MIRSHLRDAVVLYGADLAGLADTVVPPTHVKLPGVYLHAMAFDNLLTDQGDYRRSLGDKIGSFWEMVINVVVAAVSAFATVYVARLGFADATELTCAGRDGAGQRSELMLAFAGSADVCSLRRYCS